MPAESQPKEEATPPALKQGWKLLADFRQRLGGHLDSSTLGSTWSDPRRKLLAADYLSLLLIGLLNPTVESMRGLCAASRLERVGREWGCAPVSLGSFSEAQHLLDPELLRPLIAELNEEVRQQQRHTGPRAPDLARLDPFHCRIIDSTVIAALPRMTWAIYGGGQPGKINNAVRFHLSLSFEGRPEDFTATEGRTCERAAWQEQILPRADPEATHVGDRYYSISYQGLATLLNQDTHFLLRGRERDQRHVIEELPISPEDAAEGVARQAWCRLGEGLKAPRVRAIWLQRPDKMVILYTDYAPEQLPAELASLMYRQRWQVEFFFRWIKCLLGAGHWFAESRPGVIIQLYLMLVASLMLHLVSGRRPTKRMMELLQFYFQGLASLDELTLGLEREAAATAARRAKKR